VANPAYKLADLPIPPENSIWRECLSSLQTNRQSCSVKDRRDVYFVARKSTVPQRDLWGKREAEYQHKKAKAIDNRNI